MDKKIDIKYFDKLLKNFSVLFVSDDNCFLDQDFRLMFKDFLICNSEADALEIYAKNAIDIVLIDVDTQDMSWLSLFNKLRQKIYDLPIAILTDLNNTDRLTTAITIGITQCIFKPIDRKRLNLIMYDIANKLQNKIDAKELFYKNEDEKLNKIASQTTEKIIKDIPYPMFVFKNEKVLFANKSLYKLFENKNISTKAISDIKEIQSLFENAKENISFDHLKFGKNLDVQYNYQDYSLKKVFVPTKYDILLDGVDEKYNVIVLNDISSLLMQIKMLNYQQNKVNTYKSLVEDLLAKHVFKDSKKSIKYIGETIDNTLKSRDLQMLRKSVKHKIASAEYIIDLDESSYEEVNELKEIEEDLSIAIDTFTTSGSKHDIFEIAKFFNTQGTVISSLMEFVDLGNAVCSLSDFLYGLDEEKIKQNAPTIAIHLENILQDLIQWRENIFELQATIDIHYLDSSIFSSILQLQINLNNNADDNLSDDDFELF